MSIENLSLSELQKFEPHMPGLAGFPSRVLATKYEDFIEVLYSDIDKIIYQIEENPELRQTDTEDRLTIEIKNILCMIGYNASHDSKVGGHTDILVKKNDFLWIGEAKIHSNYEWLWKGFQQLSTRYSTGDCNQKNGGLFIYIRNKDAKSILEEWKTRLNEKKLPNYICKQCRKRPLSFFSSHKHESSGELFIVRHMPVILYFNPQDKK
jgi:hypothetical protein